MFQGPPLYLRWKILNWLYLDKMLIYSLEIILPIDVDDGNVVEEDKVAEHGNEAEKSQPGHNVDHRVFQVKFS